MSRGCVVGIDIGTTGTKGVAIDPTTGSVATTAQAEYPVRSPHPGWMEQDPDDWVAAAQTVLHRIRSEGVEILGLGLSGQMHGLVCLDAADRVIRPAILWNDGRSARECSAIEAKLGRERLVQLSGNRALPGFTAPKLLWMRHHEPALYARIRRVALPKDYVRDALVGGHVSDVAEASGTLLLDVATRRWSAELLDEFEIPRSWLPDLAEGTDRVGSLDGVPVAAGGGDQAAAAVGAGILGSGPLSIALGTSGVVLAALDRFVAEEQGRVHAFCHAVPERWVVMGVMLAAAGALAWYHDTLLPDSGYDQMVEEARSCPPGCEGLVFLPYLSGERTPHADPDARGAFVGLSLEHGRGSLTRAVLEGVAFGLADCLDSVRGVGVEAGRARASGGGARSRLWLQIIASVLELPVEVMGSEQGSAFGAALLGGVAAGVYANIVEAVTACVHVADVIDPVADWIGPYREVRRRFRSLYPALGSITEPS
jgi:xylulokinase